jgi:cysteine synthase A
LLERWLGRRYGGSSGTNLVASLSLASEMKARGERGSVVLLLCDRGERYADTLFDPGWLQAHGHVLSPWLRILERTASSGSTQDTAKQAGELADAG